MEELESGIANDDNSNKVILNLTKQYVSFNAEEKQVIKIELLLKLNHKISRLYDETLYKPIITFDRNND